MAKLLIFRGEAQLDARELTEQTVRIGRAPQNDIILEDPGKGVSRNHAEIRFEGGRHTLVDLQSQNGIWVSGTRVPSIVLEPGVSAALGPFRLMVEAPVPASVAPVADTATELTQLSERSAAPLVLDSLGPPPERSSSPSPHPVKLPPPPVQKVPRQEQPWYADPRILGGAAAAVLLIALSAAAGYKLMHKRVVPPVWDAAVAQALVASGKCQEALDKEINPALRADPNNQQALALRDGCNPPSPPPPAAVTSSIPPAPTVADRLNEAEPLLTANVAADCQKALDIINAVLAEDANNERAKELSSKATACINPPTRQAQTPAVSGDKPAVAIPPSQGGLEVIQGETDKAYKARNLAMRKKYDDAVAVLNSQNYQQAMRLLDEIVQDVPSGYLELSQRREEARAGIRGEAKTLFDAAQVAENRGNLGAAYDQYRRAHQLDQSLQIDAANQRIATAVRAKCNQAMVSAAYDGSNAAANSAFQDAIRILPSDPCSVKAKDMLKVK